MTDEQRNQAWASLPEDFKREVRETYNKWIGTPTFDTEIIISEWLFGRHNLTTEEKPKPKFHLGEKVRIVSSGDTDWINMITNDDCYELLEHRGKYVDSDLEPCTKPSEAKEETKELCLTELLQDCEGMEFYSPCYGMVRLNEVVRDDRYGAHCIKCYTPDPQGDRVWFTKDGKKHPNGELMLYPSKEVRTWEGWKKPVKRWKPKYNEICYCVNGFGDIEPIIPDEAGFSARFDFGYCFRTHEQAEEAAKRIKELLTQIHEEIGE